MGKFELLERGDILLYKSRGERLPLERFHPNDGLFLDLNEVKVEPE